MLELLDLPTAESIEEAKTMIKRAQWQDPSIEAKIDGLMMQAVHETSHLLESKDGNNSFRSENWASLASSIKFKKHAISQEVQLPAGMFEQPPEKKVIY